jgi:hypothetical protein
MVMSALSIEEIEGLKDRVKALEKSIEVLSIYSEMARRNCADNGNLSMCQRIHRDIEQARSLLKQSR